ncbi:SPFH domain-containing protein [Streptomyces sp. NPDC059176]|uniref:SPFH domain-containing protein n=1 Tax=unclassified Streptomyces TaxID=2593676 RepID=UPI00369B5F2C
MTPTTPYSEDPPGPPMPLTRLTAASVSVRQAGLPALGSPGDLGDLGDPAGQDGAFDPFGGGQPHAGGPYEAGGVYGALAVPPEPGVEAGPRTRAGDDGTATGPAAADPPAGTSTTTATGAGGGASGQPAYERQPNGRRTVVIGSENTGSIPVHLLFRDASGAAVEPGGRPAGNAGTDDEDDGGPDTVFMARVTVPAGRQAPAAVITARTRPVPAADPRLNERPGPVLPGWTALVAGLVALLGCAAVLHWAGALPSVLTDLVGLPERSYHGVGFGRWGLLAVGVVLVLFALGGLCHGRAGSAWVLTLFGEYRGSVRRTGLMWVSPLLLRRRVDVRLRHWRSEPMPAVDAQGTSLQVVVLVVWRVRDTARALLAVADHEAYLREQVESALSRVLSQLPADASPTGSDAFVHELQPTLRNAEAVGDALTKILVAECAPVGIEVFSVQPTSIEYTAEVAAAVRRHRIAAIEAGRREIVLTSVVDAVEETMQRLTARGLAEFDDYERKALVRDLTVAFCSRTGGVEV